MERTVPFTAQAIQQIHECNPKNRTLGMQHDFLKAGKIVKQNTPKVVAFFVDERR